MRLSLGKRRISSREGAESSESHLHRRKRGMTTGQPESPKIEAFPKAEVTQAENALTGDLTGDLAFERGENL